MYLNLTYKNSNELFTSGTSIEMAYRRFGLRKKINARTIETALMTNFAQR